jgi:hypothetical protein
VVSEEWAAEKEFKEEIEKEFEWEASDDLNPPSKK